LTIFWSHVAPSEILIPDPDSPWKTASCPIVKEKIFDSLCASALITLDLYSTKVVKKRGHILKFVSIAIYRVL
jgi:hypothetical protein